MDIPVRISFGTAPSESAMEATMEWIPWFNGPHARRDALVLALRADYSGVDLLCRKEIDGEIETCLIDGTILPNDREYCAWMLAPQNTPRYEPPAESKIKAVK